MSQFGHLILTDEPTVREVCSTWTPSLPEPKEVEMKNPFTGELMKIKTHFAPPEGRKAPDEQASTESVVEAFREQAALCIDFQVHSLMRKDFMDEKKPLFMGDRDEEGITVDLIPTEFEEKLVPYFTEELGEYADQAVRRERGLSFFVLIDDF
ncbi:MAG: hypothetical protein RH917_06060 [Lacipirellulaceae bacterium]